MTSESSIASRGIWIASLSAVLALAASCQKSSLPPLADDSEVAQAPASAGEPLVIGEAVPQQVPRRTIAIDGSFDDWSDVQAVAVGHSTYEGSPYIRLGRVWTTYDDQWVYFRIELGRLVNVQGLTGTLSLQLDADGNRLTGDIRTGGAGQVGIAGVDFEIDFSPRGANGGFGGVSAEVVEAGLPSAPANPYWFGASFAPTYANNQIEMRLARGGLIPGATVMPFISRLFSARFIFTDEVGSIIDRTEPFSIALAPQPLPEPQLITELTDQPQPETMEESEPGNETDEAAAGDGDSATEATEAPQAAEPDASPETPPAFGHFARSNPEDVRAVSWNVLNGSPFKNPEPFERILRAIDPDIICFQELGEHTTDGVLRSWLNEHLPTTFGWEVMLSEDHDVGVASRLSAVPVTAISGTAESPDIPHVRASSLLAAAAGRRVLVTSVHLKCCGRAGDRNDQKRIAEANAVRRLLRSTQFDLAPSGLLVMGDLNLVGSDEPLEIIRFQNDLNATDLQVANPYVRGDATNTTWRDPEQPFLPARLDYAFISDAVLHVTQSFVVDTYRLDDSELSGLGLQRDDSTASDHLPVVVDFR